MSASSFPAGRRTLPTRQRLDAFWRWWSGEIATLIPERFSAIRGGAHSPLVAFDGADLVLLEARGKAAVNERVALSVLDDAGRRAAARVLLERAGETRARARIALAPGEVLVRRATMPIATEENLSQVLAFEMDRLTPFKADEVHFDYRVLTRNAAAGQLVVQLAVARRELIEDRLARLRSLGINPQGVAVGSDADQRASGLDLLPQGQPGERGASSEGMLQYAFIAFVGLLLVVALVLPAWQKRQAIIELHPQLAKAHQDADAAASLERELERLVADHNFVTGKKHGAYPALAIVEEVSRLLPDNTWVTQLDLKTGGKIREVSISGETPSSSKLIEVLETSTLLKNAAPHGTVVRGSLPNLERFVIAAEVRPRVPPEAQPLAPPVPTPAPASAPKPSAAAPK
jgi:general secretion pathway protein L